MKRFLAVAALCLALSANSYESRLGVLTSTGTSVNQTTTAVTFSLPTSLCSMTLAIQCDAAACVNVGLGSSTAASCAVGNASQGITLAAGQLYDIPMACTGANAVDTIAVISVSGTANCFVTKVVTGP